MEMTETVPDGVASAIADARGDVDSITKLAGGALGRAPVDRPAGRRSFVLDEVYATIVLAHLPDPAQMSGRWFGSSRTRSARKAC
jgi:hypothetical protein